MLYDRLGELRVQVSYWLALRDYVSPGIADLVIFVLAVPYFVASMKFMKWRCPRCHKDFFGVWGWFASQCVFCGLPKFASRNEA
jgi:hypothetical protein